MSTTIPQTSPGKILGDRQYGTLLVVLGALGLVLSYGLAIVKIQLIADPTAIASCDRGGMLMCSVVLTSSGSAPHGVSELVSWYLRLRD